MGRRGIGIGNKKSFLLACVSGYQLRVHERVARVVKGESPIANEFSGLMTDATTNPSKLAPAAIGYWFWGKPWRGKL